jgi:hypothetical protein
MSKYVISSNYGTFSIYKTVEANSQRNALMSCGIMMDLEQNGWTFDESPEGEEHTARLEALISTDPGQASVCRDIKTIMDDFTTRDGWQIEILEHIDTYLRRRGFETIDMEDV